MTKWLGPLAVVVLAILAELSLGRLSGAPDFALFFGRFHPLIVHLPIGFFLLVAMGEAATFHPKLRDRVEPALGLLMPVAALAALAAFLMGQLLALEGGFPAGALGWHRRLTLLAIMGMSACWLLFERQHDKAGQGRWAYRGVLGITLGLLSLGAHFGGTMTRGESYLSKYAPGPLKPLLGAPEAKKEGPSAKSAAPAAGAEPLVYQDVVQPLLTKYCVDCHGSEKQKGKLRLDSLELLMAGGEDGAVVVPGAPSKSLLVTRMLLPVADDDHMPPKDEPSPPPEAIGVIQFWIERGASASLKVRDALPPATSRALLEHTLNGVPVTDAVPVSAPGAVTPAASAPPDAPTPARKSAEAAASNTEEPPPTPKVASSGPAFLAAHCEKCHGSAKQKGKLRVDSLAALLKGGAGGTALVPGDPEHSSIVQRVRLALSDKDHMPPPKEPQPSSGEVAALVAWIRAGASSGAPVAAKTSGGAATTPSTPAIVEPSVAAPTAPIATSRVSGPPDAPLLASLPPRVLLFADAIEPIFRDKCGKCHIKAEPAGGLAVGEHAQLLEGGYSGAGVVPKNRAASVVMQRLVLAPSDEDHMPPIEEPALSADEIELIGAWIDQGAPAKETTATAQLSIGAVRALSAHGVKAAPEPEPATTTAATAATAAAKVPVQAGGCAACSVPGALQSKWLSLQALAFFAGAAVLAVRHRRRRAA